MLKQAKMRSTTMQHVQTSDGPVFFLIGIVYYIFARFFIELLNVNLPFWLPPIITLATAIGTGFFTAWGRDLYRDWKAKRKR